MCLVVEYQKGVAYKLFLTRFDGSLSSPVCCGQLYEIGKWIKDCSNGCLSYSYRTCKDGVNPRIKNFQYGADDQHYDVGFHCFPSLQDAVEAVRVASYLRFSKGSSGIYRINYKKLLAQGIDESRRPTLVVKYMKILELVKQL